MTDRMCFGTPCVMFLFWLLSQLINDAPLPHRKDKNNNRRAS